MKRGRDRKLKIAITCFLLLGAFFAAVPFFRDFCLATRAQFIHVHERTTLPQTIPQPEKITPPSVKDTWNRQIKTNAVGEIVIPKITIEETIFIGLTQANMSSGVVSLFPKRMPKIGSVTLIGHHLGMKELLFGKIGVLEKGDAIYLRFLGENFAYDVQSKQLIEATDIDQLSDEGGEWLYLVTCDTAAATTKRVLVRAKKRPLQAKETQAQLVKRVKTGKTNVYIWYFLVPIALVVFLILVILKLVWRM